MERIPATQESWKTIGMPSDCARLRMQGTYSAQEFERMKFGLIPREMEDKWFIYFKDNWLFFHRSWTGICMYKLRLEQIGENYIIAEAWMNRPPAKHRDKKDELAVQLLRFLIDRLLLSKSVPFPMPTEFYQPPSIWTKFWRLIFRKRKMEALEQMAYVHVLIGWGRSNEEMESNDR